MAGVIPHPAGLEPPVATEKKKKSVPGRGTYLKGLTYPKDIYKGNSDHWSVMRVKGDDYVAEKILRRQCKNGKDVADYLDSQELPDDFVHLWSREKAIKCYNRKGFGDLVYDSLHGRLPGFLYQYPHECSMKRAIARNITIHRKNALKDFNYWYQKDDKTKNLSKNRMDIYQYVL